MDIELIKAASRYFTLRAMAIIKSPRFGLNAFNEIGLSFAVYIAEGAGAPQFLTVGAALKVIAAYDVGDVRNLDGKPCWVDITDGKCVFHSPCLI